MPELRLVLCPRCDGKKGGFGFWDGRDPKTGKRIGGSGFMPCRTCFGNGEVSAPVSEFLQEAEKRQQARRESGKQLLEVALEMRIDVHQLSHMYLGSAAFPDQTDLAPEVLEYIERRNRPGRAMNE